MIRAIYTSMSMQRLPYIHPDMRSRTGTTYSLGVGATSSSSTKQKVNSRSSTVAELIGIDDKIAKVMWTKKFIECEGFPIKLNIVHQDNTSAIKLSENGRGSSEKRTRHFDIRLFYVMDLIERNEVTIKYCPSGEMITDYLSKPLVGGKFKLLRRCLMNLQ